LKKKEKFEIEKIRGCCTWFKAANNPSLCVCSTRYYQLPSPMGSPYPHSLLYNWSELELS